MKIITFIFAFCCIFPSAQSQWKLKFYTEQTKTGYLILADNDEPMPMSAVFRFTLDNMASTLKNDEHTLIPAQAKRFIIAALTALNPHKGYRFSYSSSYNFGNVQQTAFDENYIYELPFEKGKTVRIYQGYNGNFSHQGQLALDFQMAEGSKVFASREGTVTEVVEHNTKHCVDKDCAKYNNKIVIIHPDGTFAQYLHLAPNGAEVKTGERVVKGQFIGYSGNTGWSNGPHLHFSVFLNRMGGKVFYIPTKFSTSASAPQLLEEKKSYTKIK